MHTVRGKPK